MRKRKHRRLRRRRRCDDDDDDGGLIIDEEQTQQRDITHGRRMWRLAHTYRFAITVENYSEQKEQCRIELDTDCTTRLRCCDVVEARPCHSRCDLRRR